MKTKLLVAAAFVGTVWLANWTLSRYGVWTVGWFIVPAGTLWAGAGFIARDWLQEVAGSRWIPPCIFAGAVLSYLIGASQTIPGGHLPIAAASGVAFAASETLDWGVYTPMRERSAAGAVAASQVAGAVLDSAAFLWLAFGTVSWQLLSGQVLAKTLMVLPALALLAVWRHRRPATHVELA